MFGIGLLVEKVLASKGLELTPKIERRRLGNLTHDEIISKLLPGASITVVDVGANVGQSVERFRNLFQERLEKITSFEPVPSAFAILEERWGGVEGVALENLAVSNINGTTIIHEFAASQLSSAFLPHSNGLWASEKSAKIGLQSEKDLLKSSHEVATVTLDTFFSSMTGSIDLLKVDTQGSEAQVLQGAATMLENQFLRPSVIELEIILGDAYASPQSFLDIESSLIPNGYRLISISAGGDLLSIPAYQVDVIYCLEEVYQLAATV